MAARLGVVTGQGLSDLIRDRFGVRWTAFAMLVLLVANLANTVAEFSGAAAALEIFGVPRLLTVPIVAVAIWALVIYASYRTVERVFLSVMLVFLGGLTLIGELVLLAAINARQWSSETSLAIELTMIMLPYMPMICIVALIGGILQVHGKFAAPAAAPIFLNVVMIIGTVAAVKVAGEDVTRAVRLVSWTVLIAGLVQLLWQVAMVLRFESFTTVFAGAGEFRPNDEISIGMRVITRRGSNRVARAAFEIARTRRRKKVSSVHKAPTYKLCCGMFAEECRKMAKNYPDVEFEEMMIDSTAMKLVADPQRFDVVVTTNQFGDILTDIGAGLVGGLGLAPGLCIGEKQAMAQATHGSAPDIAGQNIANPYAMIMSGQMLLAWLGRRHKEPMATAAADLIQKAVTKVIAEGKTLTRDLGGKASTTQMGDAIAAAL